MTSSLSFIIIIIIIGASGRVECDDKVALKIASDLFSASGSTLMVNRGLKPLTEGRDEARGTMSVASL